MKKNNLFLLLMIIPAVSLSMEDKLPELDCSKEVLLYDAACKGDAQEVELLLNDGADPLASCKQIEDRRIPLMGAIEAGTWGTQQVLLKNRLSEQVKTWDAKGWTPLHYAAHHSAVHLVPLFVEAGADVDDYGNARGVSPLFLAIKAKDNASKLPTIMALLASNANPAYDRHVVQTHGGAQADKIIEVLRFFARRKSEIINFYGDLYSPSRD